jgi:hypothetical protein
VLLCLDRKFLELCGVLYLVCLLGHGMYVYIDILLLFWDKYRENPREQNETQNLHGKMNVKRTTAKLSGFQPQHFLLATFTASASHKIFMIIGDEEQPHNILFCASTVEWLRSVRLSVGGTWDVGTTNHSRRMHKSYLFVFIYVSFVFFFVVFLCDH